MPTVAWPSPNTCFGGLIWFPMRYDLLMLIFLSVLVFLLLLVAALISIQLMRTPEIDHNERISASRMTYFLIVAALIYVSIPTALFFPKIRFFGPSDLEMQISGPMALQTTHRLHSQQGLIDVGPEKNRGDFDAEYFERPERALTPASTKPGSPIDLTKWPLPPALDNDATTHERKQSYSLFPTRAEEVPRLPPTVYDPKATSDGSSVSKLALRRFTRRGSVTNVSDAFDFLSKPKLPFAERHQRMQSTDSSATVQIGLRFSVAPATLAAAKCTRAEAKIH